MSTSIKTSIASDRTEEESHLPQGWVQVSLSEVCDINPPKPPADTLQPDTLVTFVPMPAVDAERGAITNQASRRFGEVRKGFTAFRDGDVIMAKITPCMENGKAAIARDLQNSLGFGSTEFHVLRPSEATLPEFIYHFIRQESYRREAESEMTGSVGQKRVPAEFIRLTKLGLPPLSEQIRIVGKIEELFEQVNASRKRLAKVPKLLKYFRQSVLAAASSGRLTEVWRENDKYCAENGEKLLERIRLTKQQLIETQEVKREKPLRPITSEEVVWDDLPESWSQARLGDICRAIADIDHKMPKSMEEGVKFISAKDLLDDGSLNLTEDVKLISEDDYERLSRKAKPQRDDIIYSRIGARLGKARLVETDERFLVSYSCCVIRPLIVSPKYLVRYLDSGVVLREAQERARSIGVPDLGLDEIKHFVVPLPPLEEQNEIVRCVEALFKLADVIEKRVETATKRADKLPQAILAKAFRGELVPTEAELARQEDRDYEPASVLFERIKAGRERSASKNKSGNRSRRKAGTKL